MSGAHRSPPRYRRRVRRLAACRRGSSVLEFAFAAPLLVLTMMAVIELGIILFMTSVLEGGVRDASRFGITGYAPAGTSREEQIIDRIAENTFGLVDPADIEISTLVYGDFAQIGEPEPYSDDNGNGSYDAGEPYNDINGNGQWDADMGAAGVGGPGDVVVYQVAIDWPLLTPLLDTFIGEDGRMPLSASVAVRNEPYGGGSGGGG